MTYRMGPLEATIGIDPLDVLHAELDAMEDEFSRLQAKRDTWDARRKERRSAIAALIINELKAQKIKVPGEQAIERLSSGDPRYADVLNFAETDFARLAVLNMKIQKVRDRVARGNALARYVAITPR